MSEERKVVRAAFAQFFQEPRISRLSGPTHARVGDWSQRRMVFQIVDDRKLIVAPVALLEKLALENEVDLKAELRAEARARLREVSNPEASVGFQVSMSNPAISEAGERALIHFGIHDGWCGIDPVIYLEKIDGRWRLVAVGYPQPQ